jgi:hypothetical protein
MRMFGVRSGLCAGSDAQMQTRGGRVQRGQRSRVDEAGEEDAHSESVLLDVVLGVDAGY